jgi:hypothetical protein
MQAFTRISVPELAHQLNLTQDGRNLHDRCDHNFQKQFDFLRLLGTLLPLRDPSNRGLGDRIRCSIL